MILYLDMTALVKIYVEDCGGKRRSAGGEVARGIGRASAILA